MSIKTDSTVVCDLCQKPDAKNSFSCHMDSQNGITQLSNEQALKLRDFLNNNIAELKG